MRERTKTNIAIKRAIGTTTITVASVPITEKSVRRFMLMQEDCIVLAFDLPEPIELNIGDYIDDELFGRFVYVRQQMPGYSVSDAAYQYNVTFEAGYRRWANFKFMLTEELSHSRYRKEVNWTLTADLSTHANEVLNNLVAIGETGYNVTIDTANIKSAAEVRYITYNSVDILSALSAMAEQWGCEWWVAGRTINFGKCEYSLPVTPLFTLGDGQTQATCESITAQKDQQTYANRLYVFGSTRNVPDTYDRELVFTAGNILTHTEDGRTLHLFRDESRPMRATYFLDEQRTPDKTDWFIDNFLPDPASVVNANFYRHYTSTQSNGITVAISDVYSINCAQLGVKVRVCLLSGEVKGEIAISARLTDGTTTIDLCSIARSVSDEMGGKDQYTELVLDGISIDKTESLTAGVWRLYIDVEASSECYLYDEPRLADTTESVNFSAYNYSRHCSLLYNGNEYGVVFNPFNQEPGGSYWNYFAFSNDVIPSGFSAGSNYQLSPLSVKVPLSFWSRTDTDNPSAIAKVGENRLHMDTSDYGDSKVTPHGYEYYKGRGYIEVIDLNSESVVEGTIILDEVYPHCTLVVTDVTEVKKREKIENRDGSETWWDWVQYTIKVKMINGDDFPFVSDYILDGNTLQLKFLTDAEVSAERVADYPPAEDGARLAGMTFDASFALQSFTIVRNEDYGAKLPNTELAPKVGDALVLLGWNVNAMSGLGLVGVAEASLEDKAVDYLQAITDNQFTFTCKMMSDYMFVQLESVPFDAIGGAEFYDSAGKRLYVQNGGDAYELLAEGVKVTIKHEALFGGEITSRIIGYELKLDKPYDSPLYTVGETTAYSRIKQLEKEIKRQ